MSTATIVNSVLETACHEFFGERGLTLDATDATTACTSQCLVAAVGFVGDHAKGSFLVIGPRQLFVSTHPNPTSRQHLSTDEVVDWAGETANQLLGRIKQGFLKQGLEIKIGTPTVLRGDNIARVGDVKSSSILVGSVGGNSVSLVLDLVAESEDEIFSGPTETESIDGGDLVLF